MTTTRTRSLAADLGRACSVAPNTIARIERGEQEPASLLLGTIAQALSVSSDHLLGLRADESATGCARRPSAGTEGVGWAVASGSSGTWPEEVLP